MMKKLAHLLLFLAIASPSWAAGPSTSATVQALRMSGRITCGLMPASDPAFQTMVTKLSSKTPDYLGAATAAVRSKYFSQCLVRRMAKQMMTPSLSQVDIPDNDATTAIVANLVGSGTTANISKLWSDNNTYLIHVAGASCQAEGDSNCSTGGSAPSGAPGTTGEYCHAIHLSDKQLAAVNWLTDLVRVPGQCAVNLTDTDFTTDPPAIVYTKIPSSFTGGYMTLSDRSNDQSYAFYGFNAGTNLRGIEAMYEIATGYEIPAMQSIAQPPLTSLRSNAPYFVPAGDQNFANRVTQTACLACHGGGVSNVTHGYSTVATRFDFSTKAGTGIGFYTATPPDLLRKDYGSDKTIRGLAAASRCTVDNYQTNGCNPYSSGTDDTSFSWDLSDWNPVSSGAWGWRGAKSGRGLNALGKAMGQADIVYHFMVERVIDEICPSDSNFSDAVINQIAGQAKTNDSFAYIVEAVASNSACL